MLSIKYRCNSTAKNSPMYVELVLTENGVSKVLDSFLEEEFEKRNLTITSWLQLVINDKQQRLNSVVDTLNMHTADLLKLYSLLHQET